jgi:hypothetical protein
MSSCVGKKAAAATLSLLYCWAPSPRPPSPSPVQMYRQFLLVDGTVQRVLACKDLLVQDPLTLSLAIRLCVNMDVLKERKVKGAPKPVGPAAGSARRVLAAGMFRHGKGCYRGIVSPRPAHFPSPHPPLGPPPPSHPDGAVCQVQTQGKC